MGLQASPTEQEEGECTTCLHVYPLEKILWGPIKTQIQVNAI